MGSWSSRVAYLGPTSIHSQLWLYVVCRVIGFEEMGASSTCIQRRILNTLMCFHRDDKKIQLCICVGIDMSTDDICAPPSLFLLLTIIFSLSFLPGLPHISVEMQEVFWEDRNTAIKYSSGQWSREYHSMYHGSAIMRTSQIGGSMSVNFHGPCSPPPPFTGINVGNGVSFQRFRHKVHGRTRMEPRQLPRQSRRRRDNR
jgi:hypothetical protein